MCFKMKLHIICVLCIYHTSAETNEVFSLHVETAAELVFCEHPPAVCVDQVDKNLCVMHCLSTVTPEPAVYTEFYTSSVPVFVFIFMFS